MSIREKQTLMKRRKIAAIAFALSVAILIPVLALVNYMIRIFPYHDIDGTKYYLKQKNGVYALYDMDDNIVPTDPQYGFFVTRAGTLVKIDNEAGTVEEIFVPDTEGTEINHDRYPSTLLVFEHIEKDDIRSLEVVNSKDSYFFHRLNKETNKLDDNSDFSIKGAPFAPINQERFAALYTDAGYTMTREKIVDPIKDENGEFSEYGLVPMTRIDDEGNEYQYTPAYYVLTTKEGDVHKMIIGDPLPDASGYYAQYVAQTEDGEQKRDAVYVLDTRTGESMLSSCEKYVTPQLVYPMSVNNYVEVTNFTLSAYDEMQGDKLRELVGFSFIDLSEREGTPAQSDPFIFTLKTLKGYVPDGNNVQTVLSNLYITDFVGTTLVAPTDEELVEYGLAKEVTDEEGNKKIEYHAAYTMTYDFNIAEEGKPDNILRHLVLISEKNENGNYYAFSFVYEYVNGVTNFLYSYDAIVEVKGYCFDFINWDPSRWIKNNFMTINIAYCDELSFQFEGFSGNFKLDNSRTEDKTKTNNLSVIANSSATSETITTFSGLDLIDMYGNRWSITSTAINAYTPDGVQGNIENAYYVYNSLNRRVRVLTAPIVAADGSKVTVDADTIVVSRPEGSETTYIRYGTDLFRCLYESLVYTTIENSYTMSAEEEAALIGNEKNLLLTITMKDTEGEENTYRFYSLTGRKAYITINGNGGFYMLSSRVEKLMSDVQKFFRFELIEPMDKT